MIFSKSVICKHTFVNVCVRFSAYWHSSIFLFRILSVFNCCLFFLFCIKHSLSLSVEHHKIFNIMYLNFMAGKNSQQDCKVKSENGFIIVKIIVNYWIDIGFLLLAFQLVH